MPTVPVYNTPQVDQQALPGAVQSSVVTPELLDAGATRQIQQGAQQVAGGTKLTEIAVKLAHEADMQGVQAAAAKYQKAAQDWTLDAKDKRQGAGAAGVLKDFDDWNTKTVNEIINALPNDAQKQAFATVSGRSSLAVRHDLGGFQIQQGKAANVQAFNDFTTNTVNMVAAAATEDAAGVQIDNLKTNTRAFAATQNYAAGSDEEKALMEKVLTNAHVARIRNLATDDPANAQAYFEKNKKEIAASQWDDVGKFAKHATAMSLGNATAQTIWNDMGPKGNTDSVNIYDMEQRARKELAGPKNEFALQSALKNIKELDVAFKNQRAEQSHTLQANAVRKVMDDNLTGAQLRQTPEFQALLAANPDAAKAVDSYADQKAEHKGNMAYQSIVRAAAAESRADAADARNQRKLGREGMAAFWQYADPNTLSTMSENQIVALAPSIGDQHVNQLLGMFKQVKASDAKLSEARMDHDDFKLLARGIGLDPDKKLDPEQKAALGSLYSTVNSAIGQAEKGKHEALPREERKRIAQEVMDDTVLQKRWYWNDKEVPAAVLTKDSQNKAYVTVGNEDVKLKSIPPSFREHVAATRQEEGKSISISEKDMAALWVRNRDEFKTLPQDQMKRLRR